LGVKTTSFGKVELDIVDYLDFLLGKTSEGYIPPVRKDAIHVASELPPFFERAQRALEVLLPEPEEKGTPIVISDREEIMHEFHLLGHGKTGTNKEGRLTGWSGDLPCSSYRKDGKEELGGIELARAQAGIEPDGELSRTLVKKVGVKKLNLNDFYYRFSGDLPRQLAHTLLLTGDQSLFEDVMGLSAVISAEIAEKGNLYDIEKYHRLIKLAAEAGFIPTPLLRAQYYGPMELCPEKLKKDDRDSFVEQRVREVEQEFESAQKQGRIDPKLEFNKKIAQAEAEDLADALIHRKDLLFAHRDEGGYYITENRLGLVTRLGYFFDTVRNVLPEGEKVLAVTSSGCIDVSSIHFRYLEQKGDLDIRNPSKKVRGKVVVIRYGRFKGKECYLNDPGKLEPLRQKARDQINHLRSLSIDSLIRDEGKGLLRTPLLGFAEDGEHKPYSEKLEDAIRSPNPVIIFGHGGQGKSMLVTMIADMFLTDSRYSGVVPVLMNAEDVNKGARLALEAGKDMYSYLKEEAGIPSLPSELQSECKAAFIIDDHQKLHSEYRPELDEAIHKLRKEGHYVVLLSRMERTDVHPPFNEGYKTMQIDRDGIARQTDEFIKGRIKEGDAERFREYAAQYDASVTGHYLTKLFLTMISPMGQGVSDRVLEYMTNPPIRSAIEQGIPLTKTQLYQAQTDYITACDILRGGFEYSAPDQLRAEINRWKDILAEKAFTDAPAPRS